MDMRFYWLRNRIAQLQFRHYWTPGPFNKCDYVRKHQTSVHHLVIRVTYLKLIIILDNFQRMRARAQLENSTTRVYLTY